MEMTTISTMLIKANKDYISLTNEIGKTKEHLEKILKDNDLDVIDMSVLDSLELNTYLSDADADIDMIIFRDNEFLLFDHSNKYQFKELSMNDKISALELIRDSLKQMLKKC